jgi:hypothetical protein
MKVAQSGKVWDFFEGDDFTGKPETYKTRLKTAARKAGVDFNSTVVERSGKKVLKVLAFEMTGERAAAAPTAEPDANPDADGKNQKEREREQQFA